jgi:hypothetical protein
MPERTLPAMNCNVVPELPGNPQRLAYKREAERSS